jgi:hypothetical protein
MMQGIMERDKQHFERRYPRLRANKTERSLRPKGTEEVSHGRQSFYVLVAFSGQEEMA